jgi:acyl-CoA thioester hydrolase
MNLESKIFRLDFEVRDYECDMEGIVNNAVYMQYLEHARHIYLKLKGFDFAVLTKSGINLVVIRSEVDYLYPLQSGDEFYVTASLERISRIRFGFSQDIFRLPDNKPILKAKIIGTSLNADGAPKYFKELEGLFS